MFKNMFQKWKKSKIGLTQPVKTDTDDKIPEGIFPALSENIITIREMFGESFDLVIKETQANGIKIAFITLDGMYDNLLVSNAVIAPVLDMKFGTTEPKMIYDHISEYRTSECDTKEAITMPDAVQYLISGCILMFVDGVNRCLALSVQGYPKRSIEQPQSEMQEFGSHEGFVEMYKDNVTMVRRRLKSPYVRFETITAGETSKTSLCICYHAKRADPVTVNGVKSRLKEMKIDIIPGAGAVRPFLEAKGLSFFTSVGITERPDVFAAKLSEGRVGIIVDGTPYALIVPYLFIENFHSLDDYLSRPFYTLVTRTIKMVCFLAAVFLPGIYVAVGTFHQEIFPANIIFEISISIQETPFPLFVESLIIHFIYEIVREAGLRMPASMGHAVSIVGALVIGDAAVTAGLISAPMLIVVAITAICSAVITPLHQPSSVLRLLFIILGGISGLYGIMLGFGLIVINLCSVNSFGVPFTSPLSPFDRYANRDSLFFAGWKTVGKRFMKVQNLRGSDSDANKS